MDERTRILISLGAATAANCVPCFEHYLAKASEIGLDSEEIREASDIAVRVRNGAGAVMRNRVCEMLNMGEARDLCCTASVDGTCC